jgi:hypothetical protein
MGTNGFETTPHKKKKNNRTAREKCKFVLAFIFERFFPKVKVGKHLEPVIL